MKDFTDNRERDKDDELTYKVIHATAVWRTGVVEIKGEDRSWLLGFKEFFLCCAETADGEPPEEAGSAEGGSERTAGGHQSQCTAGRGGKDELIHLVIMSAQNNTLINMLYFSCSIRLKEKYLFLFKAKLFIALF